MDTLPYILPNGYKVEIIPNTEIIIHEIWKDMFYDRDYHIKEGDVVVDIGANQGIFSLFAAHRGATVYAVEPDAKNYGLLCANITRNRLGKKIFPFCCAVAREQGTISLFIPEAERLCTSGLITTSFSQIEALTKHNDTHVIVSEVEAISLPGLLNKIKAKSISLLKIDTEGAELDILSGVHCGDIEGVERIIMETHAAYPERELYNLVLKLGFTVISYGKLNGVFNTGYLYAEGCRGEERPGRKKPVAILKVPKRITLGSVVNADAKQSFSTTGELETQLYYRFNIDGSKGKVTSKATKSIRFTEKGPHQIALEVLTDRKTNQTDTAKSADCEAIDCVEKTVWVFSKDYGPSSFALPLKVLGQKYEFAVPAEKDFIIPAASLPMDWEYGALGLGISIFDVPGGLGAVGILFCFNGEQQELKQWYQNVFFPEFPQESDLCFSLKAKSDFRVQLQWFAKQDNKIEIPPYIECSKDGKYFMGKNSLDHICRIEQNAYFVINEEVLPQTWNPEQVKVCFSVHASDSLGRELEGEVIYRNRSFPLKGWYKEICLCQGRMESCLDFEVKVPEKRVYQITWWPE